MSVGEGRPQGSPPHVHAAPALTKTTSRQSGRRATARVTTPRPRHTRPYKDYEPSEWEKGDRKGHHPTSTPLPPLQRLRAFGVALFHRRYVTWNVGLATFGFWARDLFGLLSLLRGRRGRRLRR